MYDKQLPGDDRPFHTMSAAEYVEDVNEDPICIVNGLTKNWRLPGWRVCWVVAPVHCIEVLSSVGSYMDGGANNPLQKVRACLAVLLTRAGPPTLVAMGGCGRHCWPLSLLRTVVVALEPHELPVLMHTVPVSQAAVSLLAPDFVREDALALQAHFRAKRDFMVRELEELGIGVVAPAATFYIWATVASLPAPINDGVVFFEHCIRHKVICVPGIFFDINPFKRRRFAVSPYLGYLRMSFGPALPSLRLAISGIRQVVTEARQGRLPELKKPTGTGAFD